MPHINSFHTTMVLTQRNRCRYCIRQPRKFPYHYGSYATRIKELKNVLISRFHTTMVLTQQKAAQSCPWSTSCFHTTMVLTQRRRLDNVNGLLPVSIPLWFLRNAFLEAGLKASDARFPYHYGSYATAFITK